MKTWAKPSNAYENAGYRDRSHYLRRLSASLGLEYAFVEGISKDLGYTHDFTTLPAYLEDYIFLRHYV